MNRALPMPVPMVSSRTVPGTLRAAPKVTSARPAASASLMSTQGCPIRAEIMPAASAPIQLLSMFAAVSRRPFFATPGSPAPARMPGVTWPAAVSVSTIAPMASTTAAGVDGWGVFNRILGEARWPVSRSTTAALTPVPPTSIPMARRAVGGGAADLADTGSLMSGGYRVGSPTSLRAARVGGQAGPCVEPARAAPERARGRRRPIRHFSRRRSRRREVTARPTVPITPRYATWTRSLGPTIPVVRLRIRSTPW